MKPTLKSLKPSTKKLKKNLKTITIGSKSDVKKHIKLVCNNLIHIKTSYIGYKPPKSIKQLENKATDKLNKMADTFKTISEHNDMYQLIKSNLEQIKTKPKQQAHKQKNAPIKFLPEKTTKVMAQGLDNILAKHQIALLYAGTGTGKTFAAIDAIGRKIPNCHIITITKVRQVRSHQWKRSVIGYNKAENTHLTITELNYEKFRMPKYFKQLQSLLKKYNKKGQYTIIIFDEAHNLKSPTSKTTKTARKVMKYQQKYDRKYHQYEIETNAGPHANKVIALSATPVSNSIIDTISYLMLDCKYSSKTQFYRKHRIQLDQYNRPMIKDMTGKLRPDWVYKYDQIINQMHNITERIDNTNIKPKVYNFTQKFHYDKKTTHEYRNIYRNYKRGVYESIQQTIMAEIQFLAEHSQQRFKYMRQLINDPKRPKTPIIIFYEYVYEYNALARFCNQYYPNWHIIRIDGRAKNKISAISDKTPDNTIILAQYQAGGTSIDLRQALLTIYYAPTNSYQDYKQSQGRNVRAFTHHTVYHIRLWQKNTINGKMWKQVIDNKAKFTKKLAQELIK